MITSRRYARNAQHRARLGELEQDSLLVAFRLWLSRKELDLSRAVWWLRWYVELSVGSRTISTGLPSSPLSHKRKRRTPKCTSTSRVRRFSLTSSRGLWILVGTWVTPPEASASDSSFLMRCAVFNCATCSPSSSRRRAKTSKFERRAARGLRTYIFR